MFIIMPDKTHEVSWPTPVGHGFSDPWAGGPTLALAGVGRTEAEPCQLTKVKTKLCVIYTFGLVYTAPKKNALAQDLCVGTWSSKDIHMYIPYLLCGTLT